MQFGTYSRIPFTVIIVEHSIFSHMRTGLNAVTIGGLSSPLSLLPPFTPADCCHRCQHMEETEKQNEYG
jgi:hypothetical protein